jgi:pimeloyl-ACP methyl ester carboxylesterase
MTTQSPETVRTVPVPGGDLAYEVLPGTTAPILAVHGISSHRRLWSWLHAAAPELTLVAPDLRGRADSVEVTGPWGVARHADDLALLLDAAGLERVPVVGMSMGGFVAVALADRHPDRVESLVLVDGGFPMAPPPGLTPDTVAAAFADRTGRLDRRWHAVEELLDHFCATTAPLLDPSDPLLRRYLEHDLLDGRVRLSGDALVGDATDVFFGDSAWERLEVPVRFLRAEWGVGPGTAPAYAAADLERFAAATVRTLALDGVDHAASIMSPRGAEATAELVREAVA